MRVQFGSALSYTANRGCLCPRTSQLQRGKLHMPACIYVILKKFGQARTSILYIALGQRRFVTCETLTLASKVPEGAPALQPAPGAGTAMQELRGCLGCPKDFQFSLGIFLPPVTAGTLGCSLRASLTRGFPLNRLRKHRARQTSLCLSPAHSGAGNKTAWVPPLRMGLCQAHWYSSRVPSGS